MRTRFTALLSLAAMALVAGTASAQGKTVACNDGTTSTVVGRGACSGHGGVKKAEKKAEKTVAKAEKKEEKAEKKETKAEEKAEKKAEKAKPGKPTKTVSKAVGAQVTCTDGTMSKPGRGACSGHGGVKKG